jgi:hypothetical protein
MEEMEDALIQFPYGRSQPPEVSAKIERVSQLEEEMEDIQQEIASELAALKELQSELEAYTVSVAPINKFPDTVLSSIFSCVVNQLYFPGNLLNIASVSRRWRTLTIQNPYLWRRIKIVPEKTIERTQSQLEYITLSLERSRDLPLDIEVRFDGEASARFNVRKILRDFIYSTFPNVEGTKFDGELYDHISNSPISEHYSTVYEELVNRLIGPDGMHMKRWRSAYIGLPPNSYKRLWSLFNGQAPQLQTLKIEMGQSTGYDPLFSWTKKGSFRRLQSLETLQIHRDAYLSSYHFNPNILVHLSMHEVEGFYNYKYLPNLPNIQTLKYSLDLDDDDDPPNPFGINDGVKLQKLESFKISGRFHPRLLMRTKAPSLKSFSIPKFMQEWKVYPQIPFLASLKEVVLQHFFKPPPQSDLEMMVKALLSQCVSLEILTVWKDLGSIIVKYVISIKEQDSKILPCLRKVYRYEWFEDDEEPLFLIWDSSSPTPPPTTQT